MRKESIEREVRHELRRIEDTYDLAAWDYVEVERMEGDDAYARGYHDALLFTMTLLALED